MLRRDLLAGLFVALSMIVPVRAADYAVQPRKDPPPAQVSEAVRKVLQPEAIELSAGGKPALQLWLVNEVPVKSAGGAVDAIVETSLVGVLAVQTDQFKDYKDNSISKGIYTLRYLNQPQDGDHLGTAEFNSFVALLPADADKEPGTFTKYTPTVKASGKLTSSGHPQILSLRPSAGSGAVPSISEPAAEHKAIHLKLPGKAADGSKGEISADLVFEGHGHIQ